MLHRELIGAYTSAALYNLLGMPEERIEESAFMPNYEHRPVKAEPTGPLIPEQELSSYNAQRANLAALLTRYASTGIADPQLVAMGLVKRT